MDVFRENVKERLLEFIKYKGLTVKAFEQRCGMSNGYVRAMRKGIGPQKLERVFKEFPELNELWLLNDIGSMCGQLWEPDNWITSENNYTSDSGMPLKKVGKRIVEICNIKNIQRQILAEKVEFDYEKLLSIIGGTSPAPEQLLAKILVVYPDINPCWLYSGAGNPLIK